jgi:hypothetical protein
VGFKDGRVQVADGQPGDSGSSSGFDDNSVVASCGVSGRNPFLFYLRHPSKAIASTSTYEGSNLEPFGLRDLAPNFIMAEKV